jgi:ribosomal protein S18 acetylase RimI-like enzyme
MFARVEQEARRRGACKLTLEVLSNNKPALRTYEREGFASYQLDPEFGHAVFLQKKL